MELISTWADFGMNFRGIWKSEVVYQANDVVNFIVNGQEGYFVCEEENFDESPYLSESWREWDERGRLRKKVHPHNINGTVA